MKIHRLNQIISICLVLGISASFLPQYTPVLAQSISHETETPSPEPLLLETPLPQEPDQEPNPLTRASDELQDGTDELQSPTDTDSVQTTPTTSEITAIPSQTPSDSSPTTQPEFSNDELYSTCYAVNVQIEPSNFGLVAISPPPNCNESQYSEGTVLTLTAKPVPGFSQWSGDLNDTQNPLTVTLTSDLNLSAHFTQTDPPHVEKIDTHPHTNSNELTENEMTSLPIQAFSIFFDEDMHDEPGHSETGDVTNPDNYFLTNLGTDLIASSEDDFEIEINSVTYSSLERKATAFVNNSSALPPGKYQLIVNGSNSIQDLDGNKLDGDADGFGGDDFSRTFYIYNNPGVPLLSSPRQNSYINNPSPEFSWTGAANAVRYQIQIDTDSRFRTPDIDNILEIESLIYIPASPLPVGKHYWRVRGLNIFGLTGKWSSVQFFNLDTTPPAAPNPKNPVHGFSTTDRTPSFTWEPVKGAKNYRLQIASGLDFETPIINILTNLTTFTIPDHAQLDFGAYFWRIQAIDLEGNNSTWAKTRSLQVSFMKSPLNEAHVNQFAPTVEWYAVPEAKIYQIQVSNNELFSEILQFERSIPAPNVSLKLETRTTGTYFWRMCAIMTISTDCESQQHPMKFIISPAPGIPVLSYPANKHILNDNTPELTWEQVLHGELTESHHYEVQIDDDKKLLTPLQSGTTNAGTVTFIPAPLNDGNYYWRVRAVNYLGHAGAWSNILNFKIDTQIPLAPVRISPAENTFTTDSTPKFSWRSSSGAFNYEFELSNDQFNSSLKRTTIKGTAYILPVENALGYGHYQWRIAARDQAGNQSPWAEIDSFELTFQKSPLNNTFNNRAPVIKWNKVSGVQNYRLQISNQISFDTTELDEINIPASSTSFNPSNLPIGQHYWRMQVQILGSWSDWTPVWKFTISPQPGIPSLISPPPAAQVNATPIFFWHEVPQGGLPVPHAYQIQVSRSASFSTFVVNASTLSGITQYSTSPLADGEYFWRCRAVNNLDQAGTWSIIRKFTLDTNPPLPPSLVSPLKKTRTIDSTPILKWKPSRGAVRYQIQLSSADDFNITAIDQTVNTTSLTLSNTNQLENGTYYWRVNAIDAAGNLSDWSETQSFEINIMKLPVQDAYLFTRTPTLSWQKVNGALEYHLQVDTVHDFSSPLIDIHGQLSPQMKFSLMQLDYGIHYWRMKARTAAGWGEWMPVGVFYVTPPISAPLPLTPLDKTATLDRTPTFFWVASSSNSLPENNHYQLQISATSLFTNIQQSCDTLAGETSCTLAELPPGNYYWRVRSINSLGYASTWSAKRNLIVHQFKTNDRETEQFAVGRGG